MSDQSTATRLLPCPFCGGELHEAYESTGTLLLCDGCHGEFTFPAFPGEVRTMWRDHALAATPDEPSASRLWTRNGKFITVNEHEMIECVCESDAKVIEREHNAAIQAARNAKAISYSP